MSDQQQSTEIAIMNDYPLEKYNLLIPVKSIQELSSMYRPIINEVKINPDYNKGNDVYVQTKGYKDIPDKLALTKTALSKLMIAAGITIEESKAVVPSTHLTAIEMAKAIGKQVDYDSRDIAHEVTIKVPEPSGQYRIVKGNKEFIIADEIAQFREQKKDMKVWENRAQRSATEEEKEAAIEKQLIQFMAHKRAQCETKALNRALRQALTIKSTYTAEELNKPFIVAQIVPNLADPDLKKAYIAKYTGSVATLYPPSDKPNEVKAIGKPLQSDESSVVIPESEIQVITDGSGNKPPWENGDDAVQQYACEDCGTIIKDNEKSTAKEVAEYTKKTFGKVLCADCGKEAIAAHNKAAETAKNNKGGK